MNCPAGKVLFSPKFSLSIGKAGLASHMFAFDERE
jgi:hypothetical protein